MIHFARIGDCTDRCRTWNPSLDDPDGEFSYIDISSVDKDSKRIEGAVTLKCADAPSRARQLVAAGDILVSTVRPNLNGVAVVPHELEGATASTGYSILRPRAGVADGPYLFHWVRSAAFIEEMVRLATGASYPAVSDKIVRDSEIPLPPLAEQRRIAAILDKADALRAKRREAIAKLDKVLQSVFLDMFGDSAIFSRLPVGAICEVKGGKRLPKGEDYAEVPTPYRYIRVSDIAMGQIQEDCVKYLKPDVQAKIKRYTVAAGDVVITIAGTIGVVAPVGKRLSGANLTENAAKLVAKRHGNFVPEYLAFALGMPEAQAQIRSQTGQVTIGKLALFRIEKVEIPLPPVDLQRRFATIAQAVSKQKDMLSKSIEQMDSMFTSLQNRAFAGTL